MTQNPTTTRLPRSSGAHTPPQTTVARLDYKVACQLDMLPPSVNHMYITLRRGGKALTDEAQTFRQVVALALRGKDAPPVTPLALYVWMTFPNRRTGDGDNRIKALQDAIALALGFNDKQIIEWHVYVAFAKHTECNFVLEAL